MSPILLHEAHARIKTNRRHARKVLVEPGASRVEKSPEEIKAMLREIAFVLKMTRRIHDEMEKEQESGELVHA